MLRFRRTIAVSDLMTRSKKRLAIQFGLAIAACAVIAILDRPLIGLVGALVVMAIFAVQYLIRGAARVDADGADGQPVDNVDDSPPLGPGCYNEGNPPLPIYYPTDRAR